MGPAASRVIAFYRRPRDQMAIPAVTAMVMRVQLGLFAEGYYRVLLFLSSRDQGRLHAVQRLARFLHEYMERYTIPRHGMPPWLEPNFIYSLNSAVPDILQLPPMRSAPPQAARNASSSCAPSSEA